MIKVAVADDDPAIRHVLRHTLKHQPDMQLMWEACDGVDALDRISNARPDVVVMDIDMPRMDGLHAIQAILKSSPSVGIVVFSGREVEEPAHAAFAAGLLGWVGKTRIHDLTAAIRAVHRGRAFIST